MSAPGDYACFAERSSGVTDSKLPTNLCLAQPLQHRGSNVWSCGPQCNSAGVSGGDAVRRQQRTAAATVHASPQSSQLDFLSRSSASLLSWQMQSSAGPAWGKKRSVLPSLPPSLLRQSGSLRGTCLASCHHCCSRSKRVSYTCSPDLHAEHQQGDRLRAVCNSDEELRSSNQQGSFTQHQRLLYGVASQAALMEASMEKEAQCDDIREPQGR